MGIKISRRKPRQALASFIYRFQKLIPLSNEYKLRLFLNLEWIFHRLSHELSYRYYNAYNHPFRIYSINFLFSELNPTDKVLDLGCKYGEISSIVAPKVSKIVGIDHNQNAIKIAQTNHNIPNLEFICEDALSFLSKSKDKYNVLILSHILEHLDNPAEFVLKFKDFFDRIYIELPDFDGLYLNHYRKDLNMKLIYSDDDHVSEFDRDEMIDLIQKSGLQIISSEFRFGIQKYWCKRKK